MNNKPVIFQSDIENWIFTIRGVQVMTDFHLAKLYGVETKRLNEQVKRNVKRFPESFMFRLTQEEWEGLQSQIATTSNQSQNATGLQKHRSTLPYVFTEQGLAMLSAVLKSDVAIEVSIQIMNAFVKMRQILLNDILINIRIDKIEVKLLETDQKFERVFKALESNQLIPEQGVFFDGQVFDAYELAAKIIRSANQSIVLIDNYIDENTLTLLSKKKQSVKVLIFFKNVSKAMLLDVQKANDQHGKFEIKTFDKSHDRFLIIDQKDVYHLGASLKDLGKKWFAFSKLDKSSVENILKAIEL
jgi:hypothetical protein